MSCKDTTMFNDCSAPICPEHEFKKDNIWHADEEICRNCAYFKEQYIISQKKIAKKSRESDTFYTFDMLNHKFRITKAIKGLAHRDNVSCQEKIDSDFMEQKEKWFKKHPFLKKGPNNLTQLKLGLL